MSDHQSDVTPRRRGNAPLWPFILAAFLVCGAIGTAAALVVGRWAGIW